MKLLLVLLLMLLSVCIVEETPVAIGGVIAIPRQWDNDFDWDGYEVEFTLLNSKGELISADGQVYFTIRENEIMTGNNSEVFRSEIIPVSSSEFKRMKGTLDTGMGTIAVDKLSYSTNIETDHVKMFDYDVYVHFITKDGKELVGKE